MKKLIVIFIILLYCVPVFAYDQYYIGAIGQSNAHKGWYTASDTGTDSGTPDAHCYVSTNGTSWSAPAYSASIAFCNTIAAAKPNIDIRMILGGMDSSSLTSTCQILAGYWLYHGGDATYYWTPFANAVTAAGGTLDGIVFIQGETEGINNCGVAGYQTDLQSFFTQIRTAYGTPKIVVAGLNSYAGSKYTEVRAAQSEACTSDGSELYVNMTSYGSGVHYTATENITVGTTLAADLIADTTPPTVSITQSSPQAISADTITLTGTSSDAVGVSGNKIRVDSLPDATHGTACTGTTSWSCTITGFSAGANTLYVSGYDAAGNYTQTGNSITVNYTPTSSTTLSPQYGIKLIGGAVYE